MTKNFKLFVSVATFLLLFTVASAGTAYAETVTENNFIVEDTTNTIIGYTGSETDIVIPTQVSGIDVYHIGTGAFSGNASLETLTIGSHILSVGDNAFYDCTNLDYIHFQHSDSEPCTLGNDIVGFTVPSGKFQFFVVNYPSDPTSYAIDNNITFVVYYDGIDILVDTEYVFDISESKILKAFGNYSSTYTIPNTIQGNPVERIAAFAFGSNTNIVDLTIPEGIISIEYSAFRQCENLASISLPASLENYEPHAFSDCGSLASISVSSSNPMFSVIDNVLYMDNGCGLVLYPAGLTATTFTPDSNLCGVFAGAFSGNDYIQTVNFSEGFSGLDDEVFYDCTNLTSVSLPNTVEYIGNLVFSEDDGSGGNQIISTLTVNCISHTYIYDYCIDNSIPVNADTSFEADGRYLFDSSNGELFGFYGSDTNITIPSELNGVDVIGVRANTFRDCDVLQSVAFSEGIEWVEHNVFVDCDAFGGVMIPSSMYHFSSCATFNCPNFNVIAVDGSNPNYMVIDNVLFSKDMYALITYPEGLNASSYTIPQEVGIIVDWSFANNKNIQSVTIQDGVREIFDGAFYNCSSLNNITISPTVVFISDNQVFMEDTDYGQDIISGLSISGYNDTEASIYAANNGIPFNSLGANPYLKGDYWFDSETNTIFKYIGGDINVTVPSSFDGGQTPVYNIAANTFSDLDFIQSITFEEGIQYIEYGVFWDCDALQSIALPSSVNNFDSGAISYCPNFDTITVDENNQNYVVVGGVLFTRDMSVLITYPEGLSASSYTVPQGVNCIAGWAFAHNSNIQDVTMQQGISEIWERAFFNCTALTNVTIPVSVVNISDDGVFMQETEYGDEIMPGVVITGYNDTEAANYAANNGISFSSLGANPYIYGDFWFDATTNEIFKYIGTDVNVTVPSSFDGGQIPVLSINSNTFDGMDFVETITFEDGIETIHGWSVVYCDSLNTITIPQSVTVLEWSFVAHCPSLATINLSSSNTHFTVVDGVLFTGDMSQLLLYPAAMDNTSYMVPDTVYEIASYSFCEVGALQEVIIQDGTNFIGDDAFLNCYNLVDAIICYTVENISYHAFFTRDEFGEQPYSDLQIHGYNDTAAQYYAALWEYTFNSLGDEPFVIFNFDHERGYIVGYNGNVVHLVIPEQIDEINVVGIDELAFYNDETFEYVTLPSTMEVIEEEAFMACTHLKGINFNEGLREINTSFSHTSITSLYIPSTVEKISSQGLQNDYLRSIYVHPDNSYFKVENSALLSYDGTSLIRFPADLFGVGQYTIPAEVIDFNGGQPFEGCENIHSIYVEEGNTVYSSIDGVVFSVDGTELLVYPPGKVESEYTVPSFCLQIGESAFYEAELMTINLPDGLERIGTRAFQRCFNLRNITIPDSVTFIDGVAFGDCDALVSMTLPDNIEYVIHNTFLGCDYLETVVLGKGIKYIFDYAFSGCPSLTSITLQENIEFINDNTFLGSYNVVLQVYDHTYAKDYAIDLSIPYASMGENPQRYGNYIFEKGLIKSYIGDESAVVIPATINSENVEVIKEGTFNNCLTVTSIDIPETVNEIQQRAFAGADNVETITISPLNDSYEVVDNALFTQDMYSLTYYPSSSAATSFTVPDLVVRIDLAAFANNCNLQSVTIPDGVEEIAEDAFRNCTALKNINIPESVHTLENFTFIHCPSLEEIYLPGSIGYLGDEMFKDCSSLTNVSIEEGISGIGEKTFDNCSFLNEIALPSSIEGIGNMAFENSGLTSIIGYYNTFAQQYAQDNSLNFIPVGIAYSIDVNGYIFVDMPDVPGEKVEQRIESVDDIAIAITFDDSLYSAICKGYLVNNLQATVSDSVGGVTVIEAEISDLVDPINALSTIYELLIVNYNANNDANKEIDLLDMVMVSQRYGESIELGESNNFDFNVDGIINLYDLVLISRHMR